MRVVHINLDTSTCGLVWEDRSIDVEPENCVSMSFQIRAQGWFVTSIPNNIIHKTPRGLESRKMTYSSLLRERVNDEIFRPYWGNF